MLLLDSPPPDSARDASASSEPRGLLSRLWRGPRRRLLAGLDLGSESVKLVLLERPHGRITLRGAAITATPPGALTQVQLTSSRAIAEAVRLAFELAGAKTSFAAGAVAGERVLVQCDAASPEQAQDPAAFVERVAASELDYPWESARWGFQLVDGAVEKPRQGVLWASAPSERVEFVREALAFAGKTPVIVDAQACALANAYSYNHEPRDGDAAVLLHLSARNLLLAAVRGWVVLFAREVCLAHNGSAAAASQGDRVIRVLERYWETLTSRVKPLRLQRFWLSGGAAWDEEVRHALKQHSDLHIATLDPFRRISYSPASDEGKLVKARGSALAIAVGLALHSFDDL